jgi:glycosyltransferase involved in cell wall biosynthesis
MRESLLVLSQCLPYPPHSGVANRTFHILVQLQRAFDVHLVAFSRRNHQSNPAARSAAKEALAGYLTSIYEPAPIGSERSRAARAATHLRSVLTSRPYTLYEYRSSDFAEALETALHGRRYALVHLDSLDLYGWIRRLPQVPLAVTHHSIESDLLRSRAGRMGSTVMREYLRHQASLLEQIERKLCPEVGLNVMMSETDGAKLRAIAPGARTVTVPNGVDVEYFMPRLGAEQAGAVVFLGPTYMYPNRDAVDWFIETMWSAIRSSVPEARLHLVGKNSSEDRRRYEAIAAVQCHGYVPDVRPHLAAASCSIVPIRVGGGTRLKILDAWAMGTPVVSTSVGCEGLDARDGINILIRDDPSEFVRAVIEVLRDASLRAKLRQKGRETAELRYSWQVIGDTIIAAYRDLSPRDRTSRHSQ